MNGIRLRDVYMAASKDSLWGGLAMRFEAHFEQSSYSHRLLTPVIASIDLAASFSKGGESSISRIAHPIGWSNIHPERKAELPIQNIHLPFTPQDVEKIEQLRDGGDVKFKIRATLTLLGHPARGGDIEATTMSGEIDHEIPRSQWVERFLGTWGYTDLEIWEVRTGGVQPNALLAREYERLGEAVHQLDHGHWTAAHKECREAADSLKKRSKELETNESLEPTVLKRLFDFLSVAIHQEVAAKPGWQPDRADAILAVSLTKATLDRVSRALDST